MNTLIWLRNDLRWHDNLLIQEAARAEKPCYFIYVLNEELLRDAIPGKLDFSRIGSHRLRFLKESINDFNKELNRFQSQIIFKIGKPVEVIGNAIQKLNISELITSEQFTFEENTENKLVIQSFSYDINIKIINNKSIFSKINLPFDFSDLPHTFSSFNKKILKLNPELESPFNYPTLSIKESFLIESDSWPSYLDSFPHNFSEFQFRGGEKNALDRINYYINSNNYIDKYKAQRNGLTGSDFSSRFSAWLANGCLSARYAYNSIIKYEAAFGNNEGTEALKYELRWREFFHLNAAKQGRKLFLKNGFNGSHSMGEPDLIKFNAWRNSNTQEPFINAAMNELKSTGWISNRARQNVASYLIHDLNVDWRWGAYWFEHQLIDYDAAINWGNWAYIAGVGNDAQPIRKFNVQKQQEWYDPEKRYTKFWTTK